MNHKQKVKMARRMRTQQDIKDRAPIFQTLAWTRRKAEIRLKVIKQQEKIF